MFLSIPKSLSIFLLISLTLFLPSSSRIHHHDSSSSSSLTYLWPLPAQFTSGDQNLSVNPSLTLSGNGGGSAIISNAFDRYKGIIFKHGGFGFGVLVRKLREIFVPSVSSSFDINQLEIIVHSDNEDLQFGVDESYDLEVSIVGEAKIEANTVYGALRGLETFSQLCSFDYTKKAVQIYKAPWSIQDTPRFAYRGLMLDTSRHYMPVDVIKQIIESMSYAKLNVIHWHIIDEQSFPIEIPTYPKLWEGSYTKSERYTVEDAYEIVNFAKARDLTKIFPFEFFHLGGDEVDPSCWTQTPRVNEWLQDHNLTGSYDANAYFVHKAQEIAISNNRTPVNWEESFRHFSTKLNPKTVVQYWLVERICVDAVAQGFRCIYSNQYVWYLDHLDVPWHQVYTTEPLEGIYRPSEQELVIGGEVCMWAEKADASNVQQTIWPRAAAAAERLWSKRESTSAENVNLTALPRLQHFRCLLNKRGIAAAPVTNFYARTAPDGPGSCYDQ